MPDGYSVNIEHLAVGKSEETLGVHTFPSGENKGALKAMQYKTQGWVDKAKNGKLKRRSVWFLLEKKFWPKVMYVLCSNTASFSQLEDCLQRQYWPIMPLGVIIRSAPKSIRQVDKTCSGPRRAVRSHSLVCSKNSLLIIGIGPILNKELELVRRL